VAKCVSRLRALMALERACKFRHGDVLVGLIDRHGVRAIGVARHGARGDGRTTSRSSTHTAKMFPPAVRAPEVPYHSYFLAMRMSRTFRMLRLSD
jgi:hypothetical protein